MSAAIFVLVLAISGIFLNHTSDWRLDNRAISSSAILSWYGIKKDDKLFSYIVGGRVISKIGDEIFLNTRELAHGSGQLIGALALPSQKLMVIAFDNELFLLTPDYEMIERLGVVHNLPSPLQKIGVYEGALVLSADDKLYLAEFDNLQWPLLIDVVNSSLLEQQRLDMLNRIIWSEPVATPTLIAGVLQKHFTGEGITVERLLLDIHSGRIGGKVGVYLVDLMAILFIIFAVTGLVTWLLEKK